MILFSILSVMLVSSISVILYVNYYTALNEKEIRDAARPRKMIGSIPAGNEVEKPVLVEEI